jgi:hypothetical protein
MTRLRKEVNYNSEERRRETGRVKEARERTANSARHSRRKSLEIGKGEAGLVGNARKPSMVEPSTFRS